MENNILPGLLDKLACGDISAKLYYVTSCNIPTKSTCCKNVPIAAFTQNDFTLLLACFKVKSPVSGLKSVFSFM